MYVVRGHKKRKVNAAGRRFFSSLFSFFVVMDAHHLGQCCLRRRGFGRPFPSPSVSRSFACPQHGRSPQQTVLMWENMTDRCATSSHKHSKSRPPPNRQQIVPGLLLTKPPHPQGCVDFRRTYSTAAAASRLHISGMLIILSAQLYSSRLFYLEVV